MHLSGHMAAQFRAVYLEGDWVAPNLKTQLLDVTWQ